MAKNLGCQAKEVLGQTKTEAGLIICTLQNFSYAIINISKVGKIIVSIRNLFNFEHGWPISQTVTRIKISFTYQRYRLLKC